MVPRAAIIFLIAAKCALFEYAGMRYYDHPDPYELPAPTDGNGDQAAPSIAPLTLSRPGVLATCIEYPQLNCPGGGCFGECFNKSGFDNPAHALGYLTMMPANTSRELPRDEQ